MPFVIALAENLTRETSGFNLLTWVAVVPKYVKSRFGVAYGGRIK